MLEVRAGSAGLRQSCGPSRSTRKLVPGSTSCPVHPSLSVSSAEDRWGSPERRGCLLGVSVPTHSSPSFLQGRDTMELALDSAHCAMTPGSRELHWRGSQALFWVAGQEPYSRRMFFEVFGGIYRGLPQHQAEQQNERRKCFFFGLPDLMENSCVSSLSSKSGESSRKNLLL